MPSICITLGLPGSGKTSFCKQKLKENPDFHYISTDDIIIEAGGFCSSNELYGLLSFIDQIEQAMVSKKNILCDFLGFTKEKVFPLLLLASHYNYKKKLILFQTDVNTCLRRRPEVNGFAMFSMGKQIEDFEKFHYLFDEKEIV